MTNENKQENMEELFKLIAKNPDLPVVPMVDSEIVINDGFARWRGTWGSSYIDEILLGQEEVYFREDDDPWEVDRVLEKELDRETYRNLYEHEFGPAYAALPWIKAIIVNIDSP